MYVSVGGGGRGGFRSTLHRGAGRKQHWPAWGELEPGEIYCTTANRCLMKNKLNVRNGRNDRSKGQHTWYEHDLTYTRNKRCIIV